MVTFTGFREASALGLSQFHKVFVLIFEDEVHEVYVGRLRGGILNGYKVPVYQLPSGGNPRELAQVDATAQISAPRGIQKSCFSSCTDERCP